MKLANRTMFLMVSAATAIVVCAVLAVRWRHSLVVSAPDGTHTVTTRLAQRRDVPVWLEALGTVTPLNTVVVRAQVSGTLTGLHFAEAQTVRAGEVLATIDDRALQAQVNTAAGSLDRDQALLENARRDLTRDRQLLAIGSVNQQQFDTQEALVRQYEGTIRADKGTLDNLEVQWGFTKVRSPIDGRIGLRAVDVGNYVQPGDSLGIVTLTSLSPTSVKFAVAEGDLGRILSARDRAGDGALSVLAYDRAGTSLLAQGKIDAVDNQVDLNTGTVMMRALFDDAAHRLYPNQFVNVRLQLDTLRRAQVVPTRAIQHGSQGDYLYVDERGKASARAIRVVRSDGDDSVVENRPGTAKALRDTEAIIVDGADSLDEGTPVTTPVSTASNARPGSR